MIILLNSVSLIILLNYFKQKYKKGRRYCKDKGDSLGVPIVSRYVPALMFFLLSAQERTENAADQFAGNLPSHS